MLTEDMAVKMQTLVTINGRVTTMNSSHIVGELIPEQIVNLTISRKDNRMC